MINLTLTYYNFEQDFSETGVFVPTCFHNEFGHHFHRNTRAREFVATSGLTSWPQKLVQIQNCHHQSLKKTDNKPKQN